MPFDWREYVAVARHLQMYLGVEMTQEAALRTAIGRAYYAAFGYALWYATNFLDFRPRSRAEERTQDHGRLRAHLRDRRRAHVADKLHKLRQWRNLCDYDDTDRPGARLVPNVAEAMAATDYVIRALPPPTPPSTQPVGS